MSVNDFEARPSLTNPFAGAQVSVAFDWREFKRTPPLQRRLTVALFLVLGDVLAAAAALKTVALLGDVANATTPVLTAAQFSAPLLLVAFFLTGLYSGFGPSPVERFRLRAIGVALVIGAVVFASLPPGMPIGSFVVAVCLGVLLVIFGFYVESLIRHLLVQRGLWGAATVFVGMSGASQDVYKALAKQPELGFSPVGFFESLPHNGVLAGSAPAAPLGNIANLTKLPASIEVAIFDSMQALGSARAALGDLPMQQIVLIDSRPEIQSFCLQPRAVGPSHGLEVRRDFHLSQNYLLKRIVDISVALPATILTLPIIGILALAIKFIDSGKAIYVQTRVGLAGKPVRVYKLRSMYKNAEDRLDLYLADNPDARAEWEKHFKLSNDPRILPVIGRFIRRTSLDELPQFWNVLRGNMSLVGPRPFPAYHVDKFDEPFQTMRSSVPPGITGLWQISDRSDADLAAQKAQDQYYIRNRSVWLDLYILLQTLPAVIGGKGAR